MSETSTVDRINLAYWFPRIKAAGLPVPDTRIVRTSIDLSPWIDGEPVEGSGDFLDDLRAAAADIGYPCFLRTGHISGKHDWENTCFVARADVLPQHVFNLAEQSYIADILDLSTWVVRRLIPTNRLFTAFYGNMPITREFRFFVKDGKIDHTQPYWPSDAFTFDALQYPSAWPEKEKELAAASTLSTDEHDTLAELAIQANRVVPGFWSVDFLQDALGDWWLTDMALGAMSYRWNPEARK